jgi:hypothetical protein
MNFDEVSKRPTHSIRLVMANFVKRQFYLLLNTKTNFVLISILFKIIITLIMLIVNKSINS